MRSLFLFALVSCFFSTYLPAAEPTEWTLLLFMNGKNDLQEYVDIGLKQLEQVAHPESINVIAQAGKLDWPTVKRLKISKASTTVLQDLGASDMGDAKTLKDFIHWGVENYPARHYLLILWDHGYGWHADEEDDTPVKPGTWDISTDDTTQHTITTLEFAAVVEDFSKLIGRKIDIVSSDACFMASLEVAYELTPYVDYYLGSEDLEPESGWPYHHILEQWAKNANPSPEVIGKIIADEYVKYHELGTEVPYGAVSYSVMNLSKMNAFIEAFRTLSAALLTLANPKPFLELGMKAENFAFEDYVDWGDLAKKYGTGPLTPGLASPLIQASAAYHSLVIYNRGTEEFKNATGASIWFPKSRTDLEKLLPLYRELKFAAATGWDRALELMLRRRR